MNKLEFDEKYKLIKSLRVAAKDLRLEINGKAGSLPQTLKSLLSSLQNRDVAFDKYTEMLSEFEFSKDELTPLSQFPGVTISKSIENPQELAQKTETMKKQAFQVKNEAKKAEAYKQHAVQDLKRVLNALIEYSIQVDQIYELELELLQDMDSVYDVGDIKSASVNG